MWREEFAKSRPRDKGRFKAIYTPEELVEVKKAHQLKKTKEQLSQWGKTTYLNHKEERNTKSREYYAANKDKLQQQMKQRRLVNNWKLTPEKYKELWDSQDGKCAICFSDLSLAKRIHVDHDHSCCPGQTSCGRCVRGLLDKACNNGMGFLNDDPEQIRRAAAYIENFRKDLHNE